MARVPNSSPSVAYFMLVSDGNQQRMENAAEIKLQLPSMRIVLSNMENVFTNALESFRIDDGYDGAVMLEDDIQLCKDFKSRIEQVITQRPDETISFFESACSKNELHSEYRAGARFGWAQCNYFPKSVCDALCDETNVVEFEEWYFRKYTTWTYPIDTYIGFVLSKLGLKYWMEVPFLVQHRPWESAVGKRPINRQSRYFIDDLEQL